MKKIQVKQNEEKPIPVEILAESIKQISEGMKKIVNGPLNEKCLVLLIQNAAPSVNAGYPRKRVSQAEVEAVLQGIQNLEKTYLKKK